MTPHGALRFQGWSVKSATPESLFNSRTILIYKPISIGNCFSETVANDVTHLLRTDRRVRISKYIDRNYDLPFSLRDVCIIHARYLSTYLKIINLKTSIIAS